MSGLKDFKDLFFLQLSGRTCGHEEELRQDKQLDEALTPEVKTQRAVLPMQQLMKSKEEPPDQRERSPSVDQQDTVPPHVKEEQEELRICLEGEQLHGPDEDIVKFTFFPASVKSEDEEELKSSQLCQTQSEQMETGTEGEDCGESEQARNLNLERDLCRGTEVKTEDVSEPKPEGCGDLINPTVDQPTSVVSKCQSLKRHRKLHSCSCCGKIFNKKSNLTRHMRIHTEEKPFSCPECGKTFKQPSHLKGHMAHHREEKPFGCDTCRKSFVWPYQLKKHECAGFYVPDPFERRINGERLAETGPGEEGADESEQNENSDPEGHSEPEVEVKIEDVSEAETDDSGDWEESAEQHSGGEKSDATRHSCSLCGKVFKNKWYMTTHMKNHMGERQFSCSECGKTFNHKGNMNRHKRIHRRPEPSSSPERGEKSNPKPCLKLFSCSECGKRFIYQWHLNRHMVIHTGERRFVCSACGKRFKQKSYLTLHMARHRGEKLYSCSICDQRFVWPAQLKKHKCVSSHAPDPRENQADGGRRASTRADGGDCSGPQEVRNSDPEGLSLPETGLKVEEFSEPEDS